MPFKNSATQAALNAINRKIDQRHAPFQGLTQVRE
jgi:hypothetical protein